MDTRIIEAVPNVSEGRDAAVIDELSHAVHRVSGVSLLDVSVDPSHNRSVFTIVGDGDSLVEALIHVFEIAIHRIDLRLHRGVHPRIGAVDVVPFVPLRQASMQECADLARRLGRTIADRFSLPIFLYGHAATRVERRRLENVRRGQFEGLAEKMTEAAWRPDFGPPSPHPSAGASAVGARELLIAFNVNLRSDDLNAARQIARYIRERDGGLAGVKAIGVRLEHREIVQVSINLTDLRTTPLHQVFTSVEQEAARRGIEIADSEVIGLLPIESLTATAGHALRLRHFTPSQVLEAQLDSRTSLQPPPGEET